MLQALRDEVIVEINYEDKTPNGIYIPESAQKYKQYDGSIKGVVVSVGSKYKYNLKPGDLIVWQKMEGILIKYEGKRYLKLKSAWVHGIKLQEAV